MLFLLIFSGYWVIYWQEFIILPLYVHNYVDPKADTELMLITGPLTVIALQLVGEFPDEENSCIPRCDDRHIDLGTGLAAAHYPSELLDGDS